MQLKFGAQRFSGVAISKDIISSSLNALMAAVSELLKESAPAQSAAQQAAG
jgi:2-isopropylmalate synthase